MENYFELYGLPVKFNTDRQAVRSRFLALSRDYHPDRAAMNGEEAKTEALRLSALNNQAYKTLNDDDERMAYILKLQQALEEEEKYTLPPDFLMEMMDLNEVVSEYEMAPDGSNKQEAFGALEQELNAWQDATTPLLERFDGGDHSPALLAQIKDAYFRRKYLLRIQERLNTFAA